MKIDEMTVERRKEIFCATEEALEKLVKEYAYFSSLYPTEKVSNYIIDNYKDNFEQIDKIMIEISNYKNIDKIKEELTEEQFNRLLSEESLLVASAKMLLIREYNDVYQMALKRLIALKS